MIFKSIFKKTVTILTVSLLLIISLPNVVGASTTGNIGVARVKGNVGDKVTVNVNISNFSGFGVSSIDGGNFELHYDKTAIRVNNDSDVKIGSIVNNPFVEINRNFGSGLGFGFMTSGRGFNSNGTLLSVTFELLKSGTTNISIRNIDFKDNNLTSVPSNRIKTSNGSIEAVVVVTPTGVTLNKSSLSLDVGQSERLTATVAPANATNKNISWKSSNTNVATVDSNGNVKAVGPGSANISATTQSGNKVATASVNVTARVTGVSIQGNSTILINTSNNLTANITPSNANNKKVTWSSSDSSVATVDNNGRVTGVKAGEATITVTTEEGNRTATMKVNVVTSLPVEGISVANSDVSIVVGEVNKNTVEFKPNNASNKGLSFESSDTSVVIVDAEGNFRGLVPGEATITVTSVDGGHKASFKVTVNPRTGDEAVSTFNPILVNENIFVFPSYILLGENDIEFTNDDFSMVLGRDVILSTLKENGQENAEYFTIIVNKVQHGTPSGFIPLSPVYEFFLEVDGNKIKNFNGEIVKEFYFDKLRELNLENVSVYWFNPDTDAWEVVASEIDSEAGVVRAKVNHWSRFILMEDMNSITGGDKKPLGTGGLLGFIFLSLVVGFAGGFFSKDMIVSKVGKKTRTM